MKPTRAVVVYLLCMICCSGTVVNGSAEKLILQTVTAAVQAYDAKTGELDSEITVNQCDEFCEWADYEFVNDILILLAKDASGHFSNGRVVTFRKEDLEVLSIGSTCINPHHVMRLTQGKRILVHCQGYGIDTMKSGRASELQLGTFSGSDWEYQPEVSFPLQSGPDSDPLSHETSFSLLLHTDDALLYVDKDGFQISLATVTEFSIKSVVSYDVSTLGCHGKLTGALQDGINHHTFVSCTQTPEPKILEFAVSIDALDVRQTYEMHVSGELVMSLVRGKKQYIAASDRSRKEILVLMIMAGVTRPLPVVKADVDFLKDSCVFVEAGEEVRLYCVELEGYRLLFVSMQDLVSGSRKFVSSEVKLADEVKAIYAMESARVLIVQCGREGSELLKIDPKSDTITSTVPVAPGSKIVAVISESPGPEMEDAATQTPEPQASATGTHVTHETNSDDAEQFDMEFSENQQEEGNANGLMKVINFLADNMQKGFLKVTMIFKPINEIDLESGMDKSITEAGNVSSVLL